MTNAGLFIREDAPGWSRGELLSAVLVVALLICHGALGALHQVSWPATPPGGMHHATAAQDAAAALQGHTSGHPPDRRAGHPVGSSDYAAALFSVLLLGTILALLLRVTPWRESSSGAGGVGLARPPAGLPPPRGPTAPLLQVFRS